MSNPNRRAHPTQERGQHPVQKGVITADAGGKVADAGPIESGIKGLTVEEETVPVEEPTTDNTTKFFIPILKAEERLITGVVLQPEVVDAQGDIMSEVVIKEAAHRFLAQYNKTTKMGLMHKDFKPKVELVESYTAPVDMTLNGTIVKAGSWLMVVKVIDDSIWAQVKKGKLTGLSIGGKARVQKIAPK